jgi:hypothetical protein
MSGGKTALAVFGAFLALIGLALMSAGGAVLWSYGTERNADGFFTSDVADLSTDTYALTSEELDLGAVPAFYPSGWLATVQISAESPGGAPVFVGIGPSEAVRSYLSDVAHSEVSWNTDGWSAFDSWSTFDGPDPTYQTKEGGSPPAPPSEQSFWVASSEGDGTQRVSWDLERGEWSVVIMNADATSDVEAGVTAGARTQWFALAAVGLVVFGLVCAGLGVLMLVVALRRRTAPPPVATAADPPVVSAPKG